MRLPYLGATGPVGGPEALALADILRHACPARYRPMVGVLVDSNTLSAVTVTKRRYPAVTRVRPILGALDAAGVFSTLHYNSRDGAPLSEQISLLFARTGVPGGLQLNIRRPDPAEIARIRRANPGLEIILQVNGGSLDSLVPEEVRGYVATYRGLADHALLDLSGGTGKVLDPEWVGECALEIRAHPATAGIVPGIAGGLGPEGAPLVLRARRAAGPVRFSLDAEGRLRRPAPSPLAGEPCQDDLDLELSRAYASAAREALSARIPVPRPRVDESVYGVSVETGTYGAVRREILRRSITIRHDLVRLQVLAVHMSDMQAAELALLPGVTGVERDEPTMLMGDRPQPCA